MIIQNISQTDEHLVMQAAKLLFTEFSVLSPGQWPDSDSVYAEMKYCTSPERICRGAVDSTGCLAGWVGAIPQYRGTTWELHPLIVAPEYRNAGIGRLLLSDLDEQVILRGGHAIYLGTDDETGLTSLSNKDLYLDLFGEIQRIQNTGGHPYSFYEKCGYSIVGVIPDANGRGMPDIFMAKSLYTAAENMCIDRQ